MAEVYKEHAPHYHTIQLWVHRFEREDYSLEDETHTGRPGEVELDSLRAQVESDPFQSTRELAHTLGTSQHSIVTALKKIGKVKKLGRWIPHELTEFDLDRRVDMSLALLTHQKNTAWLSYLLTSDEKWVLYKNHHRRAQWVDVDEQPADVAKQDLHPKKVLLSVWWSINGVVHWELMCEGETITAEVYARQLEAVKKKLIPLLGMAIVFIICTTMPDHTSHALLRKN
jgi:histone-lysine N-methyltransferase SETMAR